MREGWKKHFPEEFEKKKTNLWGFDDDFDFSNMVPMGGIGASQEEIVDRWFQTLCRTIGNEQGIDGVASGYVQINRRDDGKTEVS